MVVTSSTTNGSVAWDAVTTGIMPNEVRASKHTASQVLFNLWLDGIMDSSLVTHDHDRTVAEPSASDLEEWFNLACAHAVTHSPDPDSKVGCVLVCTDGSVSVSCNQLPPGVSTEPHPDMLSRPGKYAWMLHAERAVLYQAITNGKDVRGSILVSSKHACDECMHTIGPLGVACIYSPPGDAAHPRWGQAFDMSRKLMDAYGVMHIELRIRNAPSAQTTPST